MSSDLYYGNMKHGSTSTDPSCLTLLISNLSGGRQNPNMEESQKPEEDTGEEGNENNDDV